MTFSPVSMKAVRVHWYRPPYVAQRRFVRTPSAVNSLFEYLTSWHLLTQLVELVPMTTSSLLRSCLVASMPVIAQANLFLSPGRVLIGVKLSNARPFISHRAMLGTNFPITKLIHSSGAPTSSSRLRMLRTLSLFSESTLTLGTPFMELAELSSSVKTALTPLAHGLILDSSHLLTNLLVVTPLVQVEPLFMQALAFPSPLLWLSAAGHQLPGRSTSGTTLVFEPLFSLPPCNYVILNLFSLSLSFSLHLLTASTPPLSITAL